MTRSAQSVPAVDATTVHGWYSILGVTRILSQHWTGLGLHFDEATPVITGGPVTINEAADRIHAATVATIPAGGVLPGVDPAWPPAGADWWRRPTDPPRRTEPWDVDAEVWQTALTGVTGLLHPLISPHAAQTVRGMIGKAGGLLREDPPLLVQALTGLGLDARYPGGLGLLRHEVNSADAPDGRPRSRASAGRDWLAIMALPWVPTVDEPTYTPGEPPYRRCATGWRWRHTKAGKQQLVYEWWLWNRPVPGPAVSAMLATPAYLPGSRIRCGAYRPQRGPHDPPLLRGFTAVEIRRGVLDDAHRQGQQ
jgi:hypothetical protein